MSQGPPPPLEEPPNAWTAAFEPPPPASDVEAYLRTYATRYTRDALDRQLLRAGHSREAIAAAWAAIDAEDAAAGRRDRRRQTVLLIGGAYVVTWVLVVVLAIAPAFIGRPEESIIYRGGLALNAAILAFFLVLPGGLAVAVAAGSGWLRRATIGRVVAFAFVPMLILFAIAGTCVAFSRAS